MKDLNTTLGGVFGAIGLTLSASNDPKIKLVGLALAAAASLWFGFKAKDKS